MIDSQTSSKDSLPEVVCLLRLADHKLKCIANSIKNKKKDELEEKSN